MPRQAKRNTDTPAPAFIGRHADDAGSGVVLRADGPVSHLGAESLERPIDFPRDQYRRLVAIVVVAIILSVALVVGYNVKVVQDVQRSQALVAQAISRGVSLDLPQLSAYAGKTNDQILKALKDAGYTLYDNTNEEDREVGGFDVFKLASDVDAEAAAAAYKEGLESLSPVEEARYLAGSWRFLMSRANEVEMRLRYADFDAADTRSAIESALAAQGFDAGDMASIAEDAMGNTNVSGEFKSGKDTYEYTISACDLSQVYDIKGAPETAQFVGIRVVPVDKTR